jgi:hypothetical protein
MAMGMGHPIYINIQRIIHKSTKGGAITFADRLLQTLIYQLLTQEIDVMYIQKS